MPQSQHVTSPSASASPVGDRPQPRSRRKTTIAIVSVLTAVAVLAGGLTWLVIWSQRRDRAPATAAAPSFEDYRAAWGSAMAKAGVTATFPAGPVELGSVRVSGRQPFSATFTAEEIETLLIVYPYESDALGTPFELSGVEVGFAEGRASISGRIVVDNTAYSADISAPASVKDSDVTVSEADAKLSVEGFSISGERRNQAVRGVERYLQDLLHAAPGLEVTNAHPTTEGLSVEGFAPVSIEHP